MLPNSPRTDPSKLLSEIEAAFRERRAPFSPMADIAGWCAALRQTLVGGRLEPAIHAVDYLSRGFPTSDYLRRLRQIFELMPPADQTYLQFHDIVWNDVQIVPRENAKTVMLVFCGRGEGAGLPLCVMHRWLGRLPVTLVYLRDFQVLFYLAGIRSLGRNRRDTLDSLRRIVTSVGGQRTVCCGNSSGTFAALHYGLDLRSEAVLCLAGITNLATDFNFHLRSANMISRLHRELPGQAIDLRFAYRAAKRPPQARIVYAEHNWDDRLHAEYVAGLPTITLQAFSDSDGHNVIRDLIYRGEYVDLLDWLVSPLGATSISRFVEPPRVGKGIDAKSRNS
jgi:hypothetical protein